MKDGLWNLFCETGEPMCYLLCKAGENNNAEKHGKETEKPHNTESGPSASD